MGNKLVVLLQDDSQNVETHEDRMITLNDKRQTAVQNIEAYREKAKARFDKSHAKPKHYTVGDLVLVGNEAPSTGMSRKLEPRFKGPFQITKVLDNDRYVVEDLPNSSRKQRHYCSVYASDGLKRWCSLLPVDDIANDINDESDDNIDDAIDDESSLPCEGAE